MSDRQRAIELILANRIFATLTPADAGALYKAGAVAALPGGSPLFAEGDPSDGFYLVLRGRFAVIRGGERIAGVSVGETVGEMGLVLAGQRTAAVVAEGEGDAAALVWHLPGAVFEGLLRQGDRVGCAILRGIGRDMCRRFRRMVDEGGRLMMKLHADDQQLFDSLGWEL